MENKKVTVFCASSEECNPYYLDAAEQLGKLIAGSGREIIYGGGKVGLMGRLAKGCLSHNGKITGVITKQLNELELGNENLTQLIIVESMHERESTMINMSDCIVALPGGCGTFSELLQAITWKRLGIIDKPIVIVNLLNYYDNLIMMLEKSITERFMKKDYQDAWKVVSSVKDCVAAIDELKPIRFYDDLLNRPLIA